MDKKLSHSKRRSIRVRKKIRNISQRARLSVFRSNRYIYTQIIDDQTGKTLVSVNQKQLEGKAGKKVDYAFAVGKLLAQKATKKKITEAVFDRGSFAYHGRIKAVALGAREGGLKF